MVCPGVDGVGVVPRGGSGPKRGVMVRGFVSAFLSASRSPLTRSELWVRGLMAGSSVGLGGPHHGFGDVFPGRLRSAWVGVAPGRLSSLVWLGRHPGPGRATP
jgi:hypothetical protein